MILVLSAAALLTATALYLEAHGMGRDPERERLARLSRDLKPRLWWLLLFGRRG